MTSLMRDAVIFLKTNKQKKKIKKNEKDLRLSSIFFLFLLRKRKVLLLKSFQVQFSIKDVWFGDFLLKIKLLVFHTAEDLIKSEESGIEHRKAVRNTFHLSFYKII